MKHRKTGMGIRETVQEVAGDAAMSSAATKWGLVGGSTTSIIGWLSSNQAAVLIGISVTVIGFVVNMYYQRRRDKRESYYLKQEELRKQEIHELEVKRLKGVRCEV